MTVRYKAGGNCLMTSILAAFRTHFHPCIRVFIQRRGARALVPKGHLSSLRTRIPVSNSSQREVCTFHTTRCKESPCGLRRHYRQIQQPNPRSTDRKYISVGDLPVDFGVDIQCGSIEADLTLWVAILTHRLFTVNTEVVSHNLE